MKKTRNWICEGFGNLFWISCLTRFHHNIMFCKHLDNPGKSLRSFLFAFMCWVCTWMVAYNIATMEWFFWCWLAKLSRSTTKKHNFVHIVYKLSCHNVPSHIDPCESYHSNYLGFSYHRSLKIISKLFIKNMFQMLLFIFWIIKIGPIYHYTR
jgi:hypothetical protein